MDQPQQPLQLFEFTPHQQQMLLSALTQVTALLADFKFNEPAKDEERIRQHAAIYGQRECLQQLLNYDQQLLASLEKEQSAAIEADLSQPTETPEQF